MRYEFRWRDELFYAAAVFIVYVGTAYAATGDQPVEDWQEWLIGVVVAGSRVAVAALISPLSRWLSSRKG